MQVYAVTPRRQRLEEAVLLPRLLDRHPGRTAVCRPAVANPADLSGPCRRTRLTPGRDGSMHVSTCVRNPFVTASLRVLCAVERRHGFGRRTSIAIGLKSK